MSNVVITSLYDFINNFYKDGIANVTNEMFLAMAQNMNDVCERLDEAKALPYKTPVHVITEITR